MKVFLATISLLVSMSAFAKEPSQIYIDCKSKSPDDKTFQIYGELTDKGLHNVTFIVIDIWNLDVKPTHLQDQTWPVDTTYAPTAKYKNYNRYFIQENTPEQWGYEVLIPNRATVYQLAKEEALAKKQTSVLGDFEAVIRFRDNYGNDYGGQEYLQCGTEWLDFK